MGKLILKRIFRTHLKREETVDAKWYTYYCDPITKELKKWEYTQAEPPQWPKEYEQ